MTRDTKIYSSDTYSTKNKTENTQVRLKRNEQKILNIKDNMYGVERKFHVIMCQSTLRSVHVCHLSIYKLCINLVNTTQFIETCLDEVIKSGTDHPEYPSRPHWPHTSTSKASLEIMRRSSSNMLAP